MSDFTLQSLRSVHSYTFPPLVSRNTVNAASSAAFLAETELFLLAWVTVWGSAGLGGHVLSIRELGSEKADDRVEWEKMCQEVQLDETCWYYMSKKQWGLSPKKKIYKHDCVESIIDRNFIMKTLSEVAVYTNYGLACDCGLLIAWDWINYSNSRSQEKNHTGGCIRQLRTFN